MYSAWIFFPTTLLKKRFFTYCSGRTFNIHWTILFHKMFFIVEQAYLDIKYVLYTKKVFFSFKNCSLVLIWWSCKNTPFKPFFFFFSRARRAGNRQDQEKTLSQDSSESNFDLFHCMEIHCMGFTVWQATNDILYVQFIAVDQTGTLKINWQKF